MEESFQEFYKKVKRYYVYIVEEKMTNDQRYKDHLMTLGKHIEAFRKQCKFEEHRKYMIEKYPGELFKIHEMLVGDEAKKLYLDEDMLKGNQRVHDTFFNILNIKTPRKKFKFLPTKLFNKFIEGITYFKQDATSEVPAYHRDLSCGPKSFTTTQKFEEPMQCKNVDKIKKLQIKQFVRTCYIERLMYDHIYTKAFHRQDVGHLHELATIERLYEKYFRGCDISIKITYREDIYPISLRVDESFPNNTRIREMYSVSNTKKHVDCTKFESPSGNQYEKIQTFEQEEPWILVHKRK